MGMIGLMKALTPLRGVAALAVLVFHVTLIMHRTFHGYLAVDLFFVLSGFVLMEAYGGMALSRTTYFGFLKNRLARIYPVHVLMLVLLLPLYGINPEFSLVGLVDSLLLLQAPWHDLCWNYPSWSISAEWHAYLLFPLLAPMLRDKSPRILAAVLAVCAGVLALAVATRGDADITNGPGVLLRCLPEFVAGMALHRLRATQHLPRRLTSNAAFVAAILALIGLEWAGGPDLLVLLLLPIVLLTAARDGSLASRILTRGPWPFLGRISYSLYLGQMVALAAVDHFPVPTAPPLHATLFVLFAFVIAVPVSRYVEYPARDWMKRLGWPGRPESAESAPLRLAPDGARIGIT
jgi:peptidoglycan/LPS O-acetylase OafA/YrhL